MRSDFHEALNLIMSNSRNNKNSPPRGTREGGIFFDASRHVETVVLISRVQK
ncbi:hypothetical protein SAMN02745136_04761 [Anaerocolumna jejuensis DSM 15929]|uniref:Uncharacterized protein n=1 Tax=Anaerocolumna jejuensis DSM 15929 TaxID=1121322 RepID=A0A1M7A5Y5_9FIRM|nr:hypothetical protein SAMN02745136_04761 [Anaerocolumna jejuensis DSM 15929]